MAFDAPWWGGVFVSDHDDQTGEDVLGIECCCSWPAGLRILEIPTMSDRPWWAKEGLETLALVVVIFIGIIWIAKFLGLL